MKRITALVLAMLLALAMLAGCGGSAPAPAPDPAAPSGDAPAGDAPAPAPAAGTGLAGSADELYIMIVPNTGVEYWFPVYAGFKDLGLKLGVQTEYSGSVEYEAGKQVEAFNQALAKNPTGILVHPLTAEAFQEPINRAVADGVAVVTFAADAPDSNRQGYVTSDNTKEGTTAARAVGEALGGKGAVMTVCNPGQTNHDIRVDTFRSTIAAEFPDMKVLSNVPTNQDPDAAYQAVLTEAQKNPDLAAVFSPEASSAQGAAQAAKELGTGIKVACVDVNDAILDLTKTGDVLFAICPDQYMQGWHSMWLLFNAAHPDMLRPMSYKKYAGENPTYIPYLDNGLDIITAENADYYYMANYVKTLGYSSVEDMLSPGKPQ